MPVVRRRSGREQGKDSFGRAHQRWFDQQAQELASAFKENVLHGPRRREPDNLLFLVFRTGAS
jgi:hypothetical protein